MVLLGSLLDHEIGLRHRIGGTGGEIRALRFKLERNHAGFFDLICGQPLREASEHPLLGRLTHRIPNEPDDPQEHPNGRAAAQHRIELRPLAQLECLDHVAGEVARQDELDLAGDRLLINGAAAIQGFLGILNQDARFRFVARRRQVHGRKRKTGGKQRQRSDQALAAPHGTAERGQVQFVDGVDHRVSPFRRHRRNHDRLPTLALIVRDSPRGDYIPLGFIVR